MAYIFGMAINRPCDLKNYIIFYFWPWEIRELNSITPLRALSI